MKKLLLGLVVLLSAMGLQAGRYNEESAKAVAKQVHSDDLAQKISALQDILSADLKQEDWNVLFGLLFGLPDMEKCYDRIPSRGIKTELVACMEGRLQAYLADALAESSDE